MSGEKVKVKSIINDWIIPIVMAIIISVIINKFLLFSITIPSGSMIPTINIDDRLFATRVYNKEKLERGEIVIFYSHEFQESMIKRLIGLPGDKIEIKDGIVFVNGEELIEDYILDKGNFSGYFEVPEKSYFFLGDNRLNSRDSRAWINPYINEEDIEGKAQLRIYPFNKIGIVK